MKRGCFFLHELVLIRLNLNLVYGYSLRGADVVMTPAPRFLPFYLFTFLPLLHVPSVRQYEPADISSPELAAKI